MKGKQGVFSEDLKPVKSVTSTLLFYSVFHAKTDEYGWMRPGNVLQQSSAHATNKRTRDVCHLNDVSVLERVNRSKICVRIQMTEPLSSTYMCCIFCFVMAVKKILNCGHSNNL